jgi:hypothetical protein
MSIRAVAGGVALAAAVVFAGFGVIADSHGARRVSKH